MRRRLLLAMVFVTMVAILAGAVPRVLVGRGLDESAAQVRLERDLNRLSLVVQRVTRDEAEPDVAVLFRYLGPDDQLLIDLPSGRRWELGGDPGGGAYSATVTTLDGIRLELTRGASGIDRDESSIVWALATTAIGLAVAVLAALLLTRRLARPLERLARTANRLEGGDVPPPVVRSGIPEIDAVAEGLEAGGYRIAQLLRAEREFASNANHQMRSPLTSLVLHLEELHAHGDPAVRAEAQAALGQVERLERRVEELLLLARTGRAGEERAIDLSTLVADHVLDARRLARRQRRRVVGRLQRPLPVAVVPGAVGQALDILLSNALKHGAGTIEVTATRNDGTVEVSVSDEGSGIAPERVPLLFRRAPEGRHGIGLALARSLVESEGGTLEAVDPRQARFRIALPMTAADEVASSER